MEFTSAAFVIFLIFCAIIRTLQVTFEGITGAGWMSDMAVDNIKFIPGTCGMFKTIQVLFS